MRNFYSPADRKIYLAPDAILYDRFHELAHASQHETGAWPYRVWAVFYRVKFLNYFAVLLVEWDAHCRAKRVMQRLGLWNVEACKKGRKNFISYLLRREIS